MVRTCSRGVRQPTEDACSSSEFLGGLVLKELSLKLKFLPTLVPTVSNRGCLSHRKQMPSGKQPALLFFAAPAAGDE